MKTTNVQAVEPALTDWSNRKPELIGEYNASCSRDPKLRRWWNGKSWSLSYLATDLEHLQRRYRRAVSSHRVGDIYWRGLAVKPENFVAPEPLGKL